MSWRRVFLDPFPPPQTKLNPKMLAKPWYCPIFGLHWHVRYQKAGTQAGKFKYSVVWILWSLWKAKCLPKRALKESPARVRLLGTTCQNILEYIKAQIFIHSLKAYPHLTWWIANIFWKILSNDILYWLHMPSQVLQISFQWFCNLKFLIYFVRDITSKFGCFEMKTQLLPPNPFRRSCERFCMIFKTLINTPNIKPCADHPFVRKLQEEIKSLYLKY